MKTDLNGTSVKELYDRGVEMLFAAEQVPLGPWTSYSLISDPKHMCFVLSRYKFVAKMLHGKQTVMEVGVGDAFGLPIVAQAVGQLYAIDWDNRLLENNARRLAHLKNVTWMHVDMNENPTSLKLDAAFTVDVIEHINPETETSFMGHLVGSLKPTGVLIMGTPNITSSAYASAPSEALHINLKSFKSLHELMNRYFDNVFMFGMNDEVVHTGYAPMCHYIWAVGVGVRKD